MSAISWSDFEKVDLRVGTIIDVFDFPAARKPAYQLLIDFGPEIGLLKSSAQITKHYTKSHLLKRQIGVVINFPKIQIGNFMSECLVKDIDYENGDVELTAVERHVPNGTKLF